MNTEEHVSFETAKLLKEKGFDGCCHLCYRFVSNSPKVRGKWTLYEYSSVFDDGKIIKVPTLQMAMKWLREKHGIFISIQQHMDMSYVWYAYVDGTAKGCDRGQNILNIWITIKLYMSV